MAAVPRSVPSNTNADHGGHTGSVEQATRETQVQLSLNLDGTGCGQVETTIPFPDHMLMQLVSHGLFDLQVSFRPLPGSVE